MKHVLRILSALLVLFSLVGLFATSCSGNISDDHDMPASFLTDTTVIETEPEVTEPDTSSNVAVEDGTTVMPETTVPETEAATNAPETTVAPETQSPVVETLPETAPPVNQAPETVTETIPISNPDYNANDLPNLGGILDDSTKDLIEQQKNSCRYCGEQHSLYAINSVFGGECPHCGEEIPANVCHDCVRDGQEPAW